MKHVLALALALTAATSQPVPARVCAYGFYTLIFFNGRALDVFDCVAWGWRCELDGYPVGWKRCLL